MSWLDELERKEKVQVAFVREYRAKWQEAGVPGHFMFLTMAKLTDKLNERDGVEATDLADIPFNEGGDAPFKPFKPGLKTPNAPMTTPQRGLILRLAGSIEEAEREARETFNTSLDKLTMQEASNLIEILKGGEDTGAGG